MIMTKKTLSVLAGFLMIAMICFGLSAQAAQNLTAVERLMRSDQRIMELDGMLNHSYRAAMRAVSDRKKLKQG